MISRKLLLLSGMLIMILMSLSAIPVNTLVPYDMPFPIRALQNGTVVVGQAGYDAGALIWDEVNGVVNLGAGNACDISENRVTVGDKLVDGTYLEAAYWNFDGTCVLLGNIPGGSVVDGFKSTAYAISGDGTVIAGMGWRANWTAQAFKWTQATGMVALAGGGDQSSRVNALNYDGSIAGGWITADWGGRVPAYWDNTNTIHLLGEELSGEVMAISQNGTYMCGYIDNSGFVRSNNVITTIAGADPMLTVVPSCVNNNGMVCGVSRNFFEMIEEGFIWTPTLGYMEAITYFTSQGVTIPADYTITSVSWVSNDNKTFIGWGYGSTGRQGFIIKLSDQGHITGQVSLVGGNGNIEEAIVTNGYETTSPTQAGSYQLNVAPGTHTIRAILNGYYPASLNNVVVESNQTVENINLSLNAIPNPAIVHGSLTLTGGTGNPQSVTISAGQFSVHPDANGNYTISLPAGTIMLTASLNSYITYSVNLNLTNNQNLTQNIEMFHVSTPSYIDVSLQNVENLNLNSVYFTIGNESNGYQVYNFDENNHYNGTFFSGNYNVSLYIPGYEAVAQLNVSALPTETATIVFDLNKILPAPRQLNITPEGLMSWKTPVPMYSFTDNFEAYPSGSYINSTNPAWKPYNMMPAGENDGMITDEIALDGFNSLKINPTTDLLCDVSNFQIQNLISTGKYGVEFDILVPTGFCGHYNVMRTIWPFEFTVEAFFKENGTLKVQAGGTAHNYTFNHNEWIHISHEFDIDNNTANMSVNGQLLLEWNYNQNAYDTEVGSQTLCLVDFSGEAEPNSTESGTFYLDNFMFYDMNTPVNALYNVYMDDMTTPLMSQISTPSYQLTSIANGQHNFGVSAVYPEGESDIIQKSCTITSNTDNPLLTKVFSLTNYPNPFNPETNIAFNIPQDSPVKVEIFNVKGQLVKTIHNSFTKAGKYQITWKGDNDSHQKTGSGIYFIRLKSNQGVLNKKVMLLK